MPPITNTLRTAKRSFNIFSKTTTQLTNSNTRLSKNDYSNEHY